MRRRVVIALIAAAITGGVGIGAALALAHRHSTPSLAAAPRLRAWATWPAGADRAPDFRLRDESGRTLTLRSLRGRVVLLAFLDSRCRTECPIQGRLLASVQRRLGRAPVDLVVVTVDPWADTWLTVRAFAARARWRGDWHWLLGAPAELKPVWAAYSVGVRRTKSDVIHAAVLFLIDRRGFRRAAYPVPFSPADVAADARRLASS